ncbi:uncharacterized protein LOC143030099 [Oratosquilla oratoria]|uniref:uncharacterized protein LOC143030099 n=1 Tax=Oratosquilla oratoria TaxID=337810 RepID=UPI003F7742B7
MTKLYLAAKELQENKDVLIWRVDKSDLFVILNCSDYIEKVESILQDTSKYVRVNRNPIDDIRKRVTKLIDSFNALIDGVKFAPLQGRYEPGYFYGNVKTHKPGNKLRHIISQIPTPTYHLAKQLNELINRYIPTFHTHRSIDECVEFLKNSNPQGILVSMDVESPFTNVPVKETIQIILLDVFHHVSLPPPKIPRHVLENMLQICTQEIPFRCPPGRIYRQSDGVSMGRPPGVLFARAYMCHIKNHVLDTLNLKPKFSRQLIFFASMAIPR